MKFVAVSALSHEGLVREHNEDSLVAGPFTLCAITTLTPQTLWFPVDDPVVVAVADGLGGHPAGEEASALAVRWLAHAAANLTTEAAVRDALLAATRRCTPTPTGIRNASRWAPRSLRGSSPTSL
jgi:serine/threonine protein phosphatase PrpC